MPAERGSAARGDTLGMRAMFWAWVSVVVAGFALMLGIVAVGR